MDKIDLSSLNEYIQGHDLYKLLSANRDIAFYALLAFFIAAVLSTFFAVKFASQSSLGNSILIMGLCGSGKTSLFYKLRDGDTHLGTVTSMEINEGTFSLFSEINQEKKLKPIHVIDIPGHMRLRHYVDKLISDARGVIFAIDSLDFRPQIRQNAEYLIDLLKNKVVMKKRIPFLIFCNKMDKVTAHSVEFIQKQLEKEIERLKHTRQSMSDEDESSSIGLKGEAFKFKDCVNEVTFGEGSVKEASISDVERFIRQT